LTFAKYYGAERAVQLALGDPRISLTPGVVWQHGWQPIENRVSPETLVDDRVSERTEAILVARLDEADFLRSQGLNAEAVGLPFAYAKKFLDNFSGSFPRQPNTAVILPMHSSEQCPVERDALAIPYYKELFMRLRRDYKPHFIIHSNDEILAHGLHKAGISEFTIGANIDDSLALIRVAIAFASVELVVSDSLGSHVPYAAAMGAKIALVPNPHVKKTALNPMFHSGDGVHESLMREFSARNSPETSNYSFLWCDIKNPFSGVEWGEFQIGARNVREANFWHRLGPFARRS